MCEQNLSKESKADGTESWGAFKISTKIMMKYTKGSLSNARMVVKPWPGSM